MVKTMTCRELGGACDIKLQAETFGEMAEHKYATWYGDDATK